VTGSHQQTTFIKRHQTLFAVLGAVAVIVACTALIAGITNARSGSAGNAQALIDPSTFGLTTPSSVTGAGPSDPAPPATMPPTPASPSDPSAGPLAYTVKPGDNLAAIAAWFHLHGYGQLYDENKAVIGDNPGLIHPGQIITVSSTGVTVAN
jgi:nucleoid-associated protein YgaU